MRPLPHLIATVGLGAGAFAASRDVPFSVQVALSQVLVDLDHLLDHLLQSPRPLSPSTFLDRHNALTWPRMYFFLHSYELLALLWAAAGWTGFPALRALALGASIHLLLDEVGNRRPGLPVDLSRFFYFLLYRWSRNFRTDRMTRLRKNGRIDGPYAGRSGNPGAGEGADRPEEGRPA